MLYADWMLYVDRMLYVDWMLYMEWMLYVDWKLNSIPIPSHYTFFRNSKILLKTS